MITTRLDPVYPLIIIAFTFALWGACLKIKGDTGDNQVWLESATGSIFDSPVPGHPYFRPIPLAFLKMRLPLVKLDTDFLFGFNLMVLSACGLLVFYLFYHFSSCVKSALIFTLLFLADFRIREAIDLVSAEMSLSLVFGLLAILLLLRRPSCTHLSAVLVLGAALCKESGLFCILAIPLLGHRNLRSLVSCMTVICIYFGMRHTFIQQSVFSYSIAEISYPEMLYSEILIFWGQNVIAGVVAAFLPNFVDHWGSITTDVYMSWIGLIETALWLFLMFRTLREWKAWQTAILLIVVGGLGCFFIYQPEYMIVGSVGTYLLCSVGLFRSASRRGGNLIQLAVWLFLVHRIGICAKGMRWGMQW